MGLLDIGARALVTFKADTSDMKAGLKGLQGEEKKLAETELAAAEARNGQMESWHGGLEKLVIGLAGVGAAAKLIFDGWKAYVNDARIATATLGVDIDKLKEASHGLVVEDQLQDFAMKARNATFRNSQADMENAQRAMYALTEQGRDQKDVTDKVTEALTTLRVRGLAELGVYVDTSKVRMDAAGNVVDDYSNKLELHKRILEALATKAAEAGDAQEGVGDSVQRAGVKLQDSWVELKKGLGQLVTAMQPLLEALASAVGLVAKLADASASDMDVNGMVKAALEKKYGHSISMDQVKAMTGYGTGGGLFDDVGDRSTKLIGSTDYLTSSDGAIQDLANVRGNAIATTFKNYGLAELGKLQDYLNAKAHQDKSKPLTSEEKKALEDARRALFDAAMAPVIAAANAQGNAMSGAQVQGDFSRNISGRFGLGEKASNSDTDLAGVSDIDRAMAGIQTRESAASAAAAKALADAAAKASSQRQSLLAKTFGPIGEFDLYSKAFQSLSGAVTSAYDAWVSGSESASVAFKKFLGSAIQGIGKQMLIESIKYGAYAIASLVPGPTFNPGAAAGYAGTAAAFAAGSIIAGVAAQELGAGGGSSGAGGGHASTSSGGGSSGGSGSGGSGGNGNNKQQPIIYVIGEAFANSTPRMRRLEAQQTVQRAQGKTGTYEDG